MRPDRRSSALHAGPALRVRSQPGIKQQPQDLVRKRHQPPTMVRPQNVGPRAGHDGPRRFLPKWALDQAFRAGTTLIEVAWLVARAAADDPSGARDPSHWRRDATSGRARRRRSRDASTGFDGEMPDMSAHVDHGPMESDRDPRDWSRRVAHVVVDERLARARPNIARSRRSPMCYLRLTYRVGPGRLLKEPCTKRLLRCSPGRAGAGETARLCPISRPCVVSVVHASTTASTASLLGSYFKPPSPSMTCGAAA